jgi:hypothetical protein
MVALQLPQTIHLRVKYSANRSFGSWDAFATNFSRRFASGSKACLIGSVLDESARTLLEERDQ